MRLRGDIIAERQSITKHGPSTIWLIQWQTIELALACISIFLCLYSISSVKTLKNRVFCQLYRKFALTPSCLVSCSVFALDDFVSTPKKTPWEDNFPCNWFLLTEHLLLSHLFLFDVVIASAFYQLFDACCSCVNWYRISAQKYHNVHATHIVKMVENITHSIKRRPHTRAHATLTDDYRIVNDKNIL